MARPAFRAGTVHVRAPATCANLGPAFDAAALALALYDDAMARIGDDGLVLDVAGEGADEVPRDDSHLVARAMSTVFGRLGGQPRGIELVCANRIPHRRGLGSSAAAIVSGVLLARALAAELEGHPDNVAACLLGGLAIAWSGDGGAEAVRLEPNPAILPAVLVPPATASTGEARDLLPEQVPHADAAFNAARSALLVTALTAQPAALLAATEDRLHQPYRAVSVGESAALVSKLRGTGLPAVVSGAGPTVLVLARTPGEVGAALEQAPEGWRAEQVAVAATGAHLVR
jgi:homoserine kinase